MPDTNRTRHPVLASAAICPECHLKITDPFRRLFGATLLCSLLLAIASTEARGQEFWNHFLRPDLGANLTFYRITDPQETFEYNIVNMGGLIGLNLPVVPLADNLALGINPSIGVSIELTGTGYSDVMSLEVPVYATLKYNTDATWKGSKAPVGFSAGLGAHSSNLLFVSSEVTASYLVPSYMVEVNFGSRRGNAGLYKVRWTSYIGSYAESLEEFDDEYLVFNQMAIHLLWVPGY